MPDIPKIPETASGPATHETPDSPTEAMPAAPTAAAATAPRPEVNLADTARLLAQHFPALFGEGVIKPIKLRIQPDIHQRAPGVFTKQALSAFLQRHTTRTAYLKALVAEGATRIDLDGQPAGDIAAEHRDAAGVELERRRALFETKKHARRDVARGPRPDARPGRPTPSSQPGQAPQRARPTPRAGRPGAGRPDGSAARERPTKPLPERRPARAQEQAPVKASFPPPTPEQAAETEARRQRALLLRSFEHSPLSKANFGALKGLSEDALEALLTLARQERG